MIFARTSHHASRLIARSVSHCEVCIVGGGMVGSATALHLAEAGVGGVNVVCGRSSGMPSSSEDASRLLGSGGAADDASARMFQQLEARSGVSFWHECGLLQVTPSETHSDGSMKEDIQRVQQMMLRRGVTQRLDFRAFFGASSFDAALTERRRGWLDPRALIRAARALAEGSGAGWVDGRCDSIAADTAAGGNMVVTLSDSRILRARTVVLALGAFAPLISLSTGAAGIELAPLPAAMWGKVLYHARLTEQSAEQLLGMPPMIVKPAEGAVPAPVVSYSGAKAGTYFYIFPPVRYDDGRAYLKIGHSPFDPIIAMLGKTGFQHDRPPSPEQVFTWYAGEGADASTDIGRDVVECVGASRSFFVDVLSRLFPDCMFDGGYATTCVTAKSDTGERLLGEIAPGVIHQTGCNGSGAAASLAWGKEVADLVRVILNRPGAA